MSMPGEVVKNEAVQAPHFKAHTGRQKVRSTFPQRLFVEGNVNA